MPRNFARRLHRDLKPVLDHIDDCIARVAAAILLEASPGTGQLTLRSALRLTPDEAKEAIREARTRKSPDLYLKWLDEAFQSIREILLSLNLDRIQIFRTSGKSTAEIFESRLAAASNRLTDSTSGVYACVDKIFSDHERHPNEVLQLMHEVRGKARFIGRQLKILSRPGLRMLTRARWAILALLLFIGLAPALYLHRVYRETGGLPATAVEEKVQRDLAELRAVSTEPATPVLNRVADTTKKLAEITSTLPNLLLALAAILALGRKVLLRGSWQHPQLRAIEDELREFSKNLKP